MHTTWRENGRIDPRVVNGAAGHATDVLLQGRPPPPPPAPDWAVFLDVDGSLLDFAPQPDAVVVPEGVQQDIAALAEHLDGALALVSGRAIETLDALFDQLRHLPAAGLHGLEWRSAHGSGQTPPPAPSVLDAIDAQARRLAAAFPGAAVERKGPSLAMHWRAAPAAQDPFRAFAAAALRTLPGYRPQFGDRVLELRPEGMNKGTAVLAFLAQPPFAQRTPVFVGDDLTDEHGFEAVNARSGISVLVGNRAYSGARFQLSDPAAVRGWLREVRLALHRAATAARRPTQGDA